jgi:aerobic-type carbon monoxide dehydrogenase small subunit (CoxS/CutS family)
MLYACALYYYCYYQQKITTKEKTKKNNDLFLKNSFKKIQKQSFISFYVFFCNFCNFIFVCLKSAAYALAP